MQETKEAQKTLNFVKRIAKPRLKTLQEHRVFISPLEGCLRIPEEHQRSNGDFTLLGCSGMRSLFLIKQLMKSFEGDIIPQLIILDYSRQAMAFWLRLKICFKRSMDLDALNTKLDAFEKTFLAHCVPPRERSVIEEIKGNIKLLTDSGMPFAFIKKIIEKMNLIAHDWRAKAPFDYIQTLPYPKDLIVYASNIAEYLIALEGDKKRSLEQLNSFLQNICSLKPSMTIHFRTKATYKGDPCHCFATEPVILTQNDQMQPNIQLNALTHPAFRSWALPAANPILTNQFAVFKIASGDIQQRQQNPPPQPSKPLN